MDFSYTGLCRNQAGIWYINKGKVDFTYNATVKATDGKTYTIKNGKVVTDPAGNPTSGAASNTSSNSTARR